MIEKDKYLAASPVKVDQKELISLSGIGKMIQLDPSSIRSLQAGSYVSQYKGRGMEFDESRPYHPGDDPRNIDWRVTARSSQAYTKLFREERERPVYIVTDLRSNMHFATRGSFKSVIASYLAGAISWAAHHRGDRLGGIIFGDKYCEEIKPKLGRQAALRYTHKVCTHPDWNITETEDATMADRAFNGAATSLRKFVRPGSLVVVISDFNGLSRISRSYLARISRYSDMLSIVINDPIEESPPPAGRYRLVSSQKDISIDTYSEYAREQYAANFAEKKRSLFNFFKLYSIAQIRISTSDDPIDILKQNLSKNRTN